MPAAYHAAGLVLPYGMGIKQWIAERSEKLMREVRGMIGPPAYDVAKMPEGFATGFERRPKPGNKPNAFGEELETDAELRERLRTAAEWWRYEHVDLPVHLRLLAHGATGLWLGGFRLAADPSDGSIRLWHDAGLSAEQAMAAHAACLKHVPPGIRFEIDCAPDQGGGGGPNCDGGKPSA